MEFMDSNLEARLKEGEQKHKKHLRLYNFGCSRLEAGKRSFAPFTDMSEVGFFKSVWNATKRILFFFALIIITEKFGASLLIYAALNLIQLVGGLILRNVNGKALDELQAHWRDEQEKYYNHVAPMCGIDPQDNMCHYSDGINVWSGGVNIPIDRDYGEVNVYDRSRTSLYDVCEFRKFQGYTDDYMLENEIASLEFKDRYFVITAKSNLLDAVSLVSPAFQVCLLDDPYISKYHSFHTRDDRMMMETPYGAPDYNRVSVLCDVSLQSCFASVEEHCQTLRRSCDAVHAQVQNLPVLRKGIHVLS